MNGDFIAGSKGKAYREFRGKRRHFEKGTIE